MIECLNLWVNFCSVDLRFKLRKGTESFAVSSFAFFFAIAVVTNVNTNNFALESVNKTLGLVCALFLYVNKLVDL